MLNVYKNVYVQRKKRRNSQIFFGDPCVTALPFAFKYLNVSDFNILFRSHLVHYVCVFSIQNVRQA